MGRGGTSGIGVAAFENGGLILDGGHKFKDKGAFSPSAASHVPPGPVLFRRDFPDWPIVLAIPNTKGVHDAEEVDIFKKFCPIPLAEVQEISHVILMQMLPALVEEDLESFGKAINHFQIVGFKKREVELQPRPVLDIMEYMRDNGASGAGISSFGPVVYGIVGSPGEGKKLQKEVQSMLDESLGGKSTAYKGKEPGRGYLRGSRLKINTWFGVLEIGSTGEVLESELFSKDIRELALRSLALRENRQNLPPGGFDLKAAALECRFVESPSEYYSLLHEVTLEAVKIQVSEALTPDQRIIQAVEALDDINETTNSLSERLFEWYGGYFPESGLNGEALALFIAKYGSRENIGPDDPLYSKSQGFHGCKTRSCR